MRANSRRDFLSRAFQISGAAVLTTIAGCSGGSSNGNSTDETENLEAIDSISFAGTEIKIGFSEKAIGKTINLLPPNSDEPIAHWTVEGDKTSIVFSLVKSTTQGTMPISSGKHLLEVVENTEVISKRELDLKPDLRLMNIDIPSSPGAFDVNIKFRNRGTLPAGIESASVSSSVPDPADGDDMRSSRIDSTARNLQRMVKIDKTAQFNFNSLLFSLGSEKEMRNYTVKNSSLSSRKCDGDQREATLVIKTSQGNKIKLPFTYSLSGDVARSGLSYRCSNLSLSFSSNKYKKTTSTQKNGG